VLEFPDQRYLAQALRYAVIVHLHSHVVATDFRYGRDHPCADLAAFPVAGVDIRADQLRFKSDHATSVHALRLHR
jgi:hypothetical protein